jgi:hypothetical protein
MNNIDIEVEFIPMYNVVETMAGKMNIPEGVTVDVSMKGMDIDTYDKLLNFLMGLVVNKEIEDEI